MWCIEHGEPSIRLTLKNGEQDHGQVMNFGTIRLRKRP